MRDLLIKRNKLIDNSARLRELKFDKTIRNKDVGGLISEQNKVYNKYKFYDNYIKQITKEKRRNKDVLCNKEL